MLILLSLFPGVRARDTVFLISNNNKGIYPNFTSYVIFLHDQAIGSLEAGGKTFTDSLETMMPTVAIYQQLHEKEEKSFILLRQLTP